MFYQYILIFPSLAQIVVTASKTLLGFKANTVYHTGFFFSLLWQCSASGTICISQEMLCYAMKSKQPPTLSDLKRTMCISCSRSLSILYSQGSLLHSMSTQVSRMMETLSFLTFLVAASKGRENAEKWPQAQPRSELNASTQKCTHISLAKTND